MNTSGPRLARICLLSSMLLTPACPWAAPPPKPAVRPVARPVIEVVAQASELPPMETGRVIWGRLLKEDSRSVFEVFSAWLGQAGDARPPVAAAIVNLAAYMTRKDLAAAGSEANAQIATPREAFEIDIDGENYHAVQVARARLDAGGHLGALQPLSTGMVSDERFRLRVTSTFDALVVLGNLNVRGVATQMYPAQTGLAVVIPAGQPVWLPLGEKEYFQLAGEPGGGHFTLTLRDPRSLLTDQAATVPAWRLDDAAGTSFVQARQEGRYPVFAESLRLQPPTP